MLLFFAVRFAWKYAIRVCTLLKLSEHVALTSKKLVSYISSAKGFIFEVNIVVYHNQSTQPQSRKSVSQAHRMKCIAASNDLLTNFIGMIKDCRNFNIKPHCFKALTWNQNEFQMMMMFRRSWRTSQWHLFLQKVKFLLPLGESHRFICVNVQQPKLPMELNQVRSFR